MKTYYYNLINNSRDGFYANTLKHSIKFSKKEFKEIVTKATVELLKQENQYYDTFEFLEPHVIEKLCSDYGFTVLNPKLKARVFIDGLDSLTDNNDSTNCSMVKKIKKEYNKI